METTHEQLHLQKMRLGTVKDKGQTTTCTLITILFREAFKYCNGAKS
jgi:hypothetical protein